MKKIYLSVVALFCFGIIAFAQPTLTQANFIPAIGTSQLYYVADTNTILDNTAGANVVFDYSMMHGYGQSQTQYFIDPTTTPNTGDFPSATFTDTTDNFAVNMKYNQDFTDSLDLIGLVLEINSFGTVVGKYDADPETVMKFPFNYGDSYTDSYGGQFTSPSVSLPTNGNGTVTVNADAWGTLKLPITPQIDSVLRVVRVENLLTDTIFLQPLFPNILPIPINATQISYYKPSISKNPLLSYIITDVNGDTTINVISQFPMNFVGINESNGNNFGLSLYPNPSNKDYSMLSFDLENSALVKINLINQLGQNISSVFNGNMPLGKHQIKIKTSNLSDGLYILNANIGGKIISQKLIVQ